MRPRLRSPGAQLTQLLLSACRCLHMSASLAARSLVAIYERRTPESTLLYKVLQTHWRTFESELNADSLCDVGGLRSFVRSEFESFLRCGITAHGFVRVRCNDCADSFSMQSGMRLVCVSQAWGRWRLHHYGAWWPRDHAGDCQFGA